MSQPGQSITTSGANTPDRLYVLIDGLPEHQAWDLSQQAVRIAQNLAPKLTGHSSQNLRTYFGAGFYGIRWLDPWTWYQEAGTKPRVMTNLAGKTIPMWIDDPTGKERSKSPSAKVRVTASGKTQVLIFRRAAKVGDRKTVKRKVRGTFQMVDVPSSYPGAPGRITRRQVVKYPGPSSGKIAVRNVGVRWFNPGITPKHFLHHAILTVAAVSGFGNPQIHQK